MIKRLWGTLLVGAVLGVGVVLVPVGAATAASPDSLICLVNDARSAQGKEPLTRSVSMDAVALAWAKKMATSGVFVHNPKYSQQIPSGWLRAGENIAKGYSTTTQVHAAWMASPGHRANILGDYNWVGLAHYKYTKSGVSTYFSVQVFAKYPASKSLTIADSDCSAPLDLPVLDVENDPPATNPPIDGPPANAPWVRTPKWGPH